MNAPIRTLLCVGLALLHLTAARAELVFGTPPPEIAGGREVYAPLVTHLSRLLGEPVVYRPSATWLGYQRDLREGRFDLAFDAPHFVAWRMMNSNHQPLVNLPSPLAYSVVTGGDEKSINGLDDLITRRVCALPPPHLGTMLFQNQFTDPIRQPRLVAIDGGMEEVHQALGAGLCAAAILRQGFFAQTLSDGERASLKVVYTTQELPNYALTAGPKLTPDQREAIIRSLSDEPDGIQASAGLRERLDPAATALVRSNGPDYIVHNYFLLQRAVFGW
ncbi:MAG: phosphate/phosphite/phosphonate ABC transporter substrate-binding protein [Pseudomonadota bacterium]|nr:phosphate/phosphite/phosphonate ABC transporter substrate-binding protein [Pseudomonadota bacterium]